PLPTPRSRTPPQSSLRRRQRIRKHNDPLLGQPQRRLFTAPPIVQRDQSARKPAAGLDRLQLGLRQVPAEVQPRTEPADAISTNEGINVANVIRLQNDGRCRRIRIKPRPKLRRVIWRRERIQHQSLASRLDPRAGHHRLPSLPWLPMRMFHPPDPQSGRDISYLNP